MGDFAEATGLSGQAKPRRYLWTDAFAVCNYLGLARQTGDGRYLRFAEVLVDQVHHVLGRHRPDDSRRGWISGLPNDEGERHPTLGGLRIGKPLNERGPHERMDSRLEWERDGQYFHYLTKWMHALHRMSQETGDGRYRRWAAELAVAAHAAFTCAPIRSRPRWLVWKMSIDLTRPLISTMGQHDPLDGLITFLELQSAGVGGEGGADLTAAIAEMTELCALGQWATDDPLGIGGLLDNAARFAQLVFEQKVVDPELLQRLLADAQQSLKSLNGASLLRRPANQRLAFRELGLSIGIQVATGR